jgi:hypothetical protein
MIELSPFNVSWIDGKTDDPEDMCAHGGVLLKIDDKTIVGEDDGDEWSVSATALHLLRTLENNHTESEPLFGHIIECCGFSMYAMEGSEDVVLCGCPNGIDFEVIHDANKVQINYNKEFYLLDRIDWYKAVIHFSNEVKKIYIQSSPKKPWDEVSEQGFNCFMAEWERRHLAASKNLKP